MSDTIITPRYSPRRHIVRTEALSSPNSVRVFKQSPEDGILQIRLNKDYVAATLSPSELREIAASLLTVATEIDGKTA